MSPREQLADSARRTRIPLYVITGLYVGIGFVLLVCAAVAGDPLSAFLGFLIVSGALGLAIVLNTVLRLGSRVSAIDEGIEEIRASLDRIERDRLGSEMKDDAQPGEIDPNMLDLAAIGPGDPSLLAAATLDRSVFPRLVRTMDDAPPPAPIPARRHPKKRPARGEEASSDRGWSGRKLAEPPGRAAPLKNLLATWHAAVRSGDLSICREVFAAIVDTAAPESVAAFADELERLTDEIETDLRAEFARRARGGDLAGALATGERIAALLPDRPVAAEFVRLKPLLEQRKGRDDDRLESEPLCSSVAVP